MIIYAIERGEYSDYRMGPFFLEEKDAKKYCELNNTSATWNEYTYTEEGVYDTLSDPIEWISIHREVPRYLGSPEPREYLGLEFPELIPDMKPVEVQVRYHKQTGMSASRFLITVKGTDLPRVRKVSSEVQARIRAEYDIYEEKAKKVALSEHVERLVAELEAE